jgi:hypothetical protein
MQAEFSDHSNHYLLQFFISPTFIVHCAMFPSFSIFWILLRQASLFINSFISSVQIRCGVPLLWCPTGPHSSASHVMCNLLFKEYVLSASVLKSSVFWKITTCSPLEVNRRFGGACRLHLQGRTIIHERHHREAGSK